MMVRVSFDTAFYIFYNKQTSYWEIFLTLSQAEDNHNSGKKQAHSIKRKI